MKDIVNSCLEQLRKIFGIYVGTLALIVLNTVVVFLDKIFSFETSELKVFDLKVHVEYFSLIYGLLFGLFLVILFLQVRQLKDTLVAALAEEPDQTTAISRAVNYFPWLASPFRAGTSGYIIFGLPLLIGMLILFKLVLSHIFGKPTTSHEFGYHLIAAIDAFIFIGGCYFLLKIYRDILYIRKKVHSEHF